VDKYPLKKYPVVGACGLNCGLCPRYHTEGSSRCPGCCGPGFWEKHPACGVITCCVRERGLETCADCVDWEACDRVAKILASAECRDSFISYRPLRANFAFIRQHGIAEFARRELAKQELLRYLISNYDEGRSKSYYCTACQLLPLDRLQGALADVAASIPEEADLKEKAKVVRAVIDGLADSLGISLKLRK
jgi:hypothetical protein